MSRFATYKGKTYRLLWLGTGKFGPCARLGFLDGSKEFWATAELVQETQARNYNSVSARNSSISKGYGRRLTPRDGGDYYSSGQYDEDS